MDLYFKGEDVIGCKMSEKYDGVQGNWDGEIMRTRTGNIIHAPRWWLQGLPQKHLVGELWVGRGCFDEARAIVCSAAAGDRWRKIHYMVFKGATQVEDLGFNAKVIIQELISTQFQLNAFYKKIVGSGGEGVVITTPSGRQLKRKPIKEDEGQLVGYKEGTGRNAGRIGSLILRLRNGRDFRLGGFDDDLREMPPKIGAIIQFSYQGLTSKGLPRFAAFEGIRAETSLKF